MQKIFRFKGGSRFRKNKKNSQNCDASKQDLFCKKDNLHISSNDNGVKKRKLYKFSMINIQQFIRIELK